MRSITYGYPFDHWLLPRARIFAHLHVLTVEQSLKTQLFVNIMIVHKFGFAFRFLNHCKVNLKKILKWNVHPCKVFINSMRSVKPKNQSKVVQPLEWLFASQLSNRSYQMTMFIQLFIWKLNVTAISNAFRNLAIIDRKFYQR